MTTDDSALQNAWSPKESNLFCKAE